MNPLIPILRLPMMLATSRSGSETGRPTPNATSKWRDTIKISDRLFVYKALPL
ncbi:hypothetical protein [Persicirhabdus sediminis]|uniref:hypothetical protein n=1 Tax=Persicirhabdus sediminis TaxID=454144 RepID=UPI001F2E8D48|nr:hypothetical protein [Persicirhabdus sediminis]